MIDRLIEILAGGFVSWILLLEVRLQMTQRKLGKLEEKSNDDAIRENDSKLTADELDALLANDLQPKPGDSKA